jgi:hypothetical protein
MLCFTFVGCGGGSHAESPDQALVGLGNKTATCNGAMAGGSGPVDPRLATSVGRFTVWGTGRDFRTAQKTAVSGFSGLRQRHVHGPILATKTPLIVEGKTPLTVSIAPPDQPRAGLIAGVPFGGGPYAEIRFVPCHDQPRTTWAGGWVLRDQGPVTLSVRQDKGPELQLVVGRP